MSRSLGDDVGRPGIEEKKGGQQAVMEVNIITILYICKKVSKNKNFERPRSRWTEDWTPFPLGSM